MLQIFLRISKKFIFNQRVYLSKSLFVLQKNKGRSKDPRSTLSETVTNFQPILFIGTNPVHSINSDNRITIVINSFRTKSLFTGSLHIVQNAKDMFVRNASSMFVVGCRVGDASTNVPITIPNGLLFVSSFHCFSVITICAVGTANY